MANREKDNNRIKKWQKEKCKCYSIRFSSVSEREEQEWMEKHRPANAYLKKLIREDMNKQE